jgi:hypothetical protein
MSEAYHANLPTQSQGEANVGCWPKADIRQETPDVRFGPEADIANGGLNVGVGKE